MINKKISLYLDTSVIGGYYDDEFQDDTRLLFEKIKEGEYSIFISNVTEKELENAPNNVRNLLNEFEYRQIIVSDECVKLADEYIKEGVVGLTNKEDCIHIATATMNDIDFLISWNFKHIVNIKRIRGYNSVNLKNGYRQLEIHSPKELGLL
jgi:predicted nucleic acid-binding protein